MFSIKKSLFWQGKRQYSHIHVIDAQFAMEMFAYVTAEPHSLIKWINTDVPGQLKHSLLHAAKNDFLA